MAAGNETARAMAMARDEAAKMMMRWLPFEQRTIYLTARRRREGVSGGLASTGITGQKQSPYIQVRRGRISPKAIRNKGGTR